MTVLYVLLALIGAGVSYVGYLLYQEEHPRQSSPPRQPSPQKIPTPSASPRTSAKSILKNLGLEKDSLSRFMPTLKPKPIFPFKKTQQKAPTEPGTGTAALKLTYTASTDQTQPATEVPLTDKNLSSSPSFKRFESLHQQVHELKEKSERLDHLFQEKCRQLSETESALTNEQANRKEFNKVKDLLEKELRESRDKSRNLKIELANAQTESQSHLKRIKQLEDKIEKTQHDVTARSHEMTSAQAEKDEEKNRLARLEERLRKTEALLEEKNSKIKELVNRLQELEALGVSMQSPGKPLEQPTTTPDRKMPVSEPPAPEVRSEEQPELKIPSPQKEATPNNEKEAHPPDLAAMTLSLDDSKIEPKDESSPSKSEETASGLKSLLNTIENEPSPIQEPAVSQEPKDDIPPQDPGMPQPLVNVNDKKTSTPQVAPTSFDQNASREEADTQKATPFEDTLSREVKPQEPSHKPDALRKDFGLSLAPDILENQMKKIKEEIEGALGNESKDQKDTDPQTPEKT